MKEVRFYGTLGEGQLKLDRPEIMKEWIKSQVKEPRPIVLVIKDQSKEVTREQRGYYFAMIVKPLAEHLGYEPEEMEYELDRALLTQSGRKGQKFIRSKSGLTQEEWSKLIDGAIRLAAKVGFVVEPPDRKWRLHGKE